MADDNPEMKVVLLSPAVRYRLVAGLRSRRPQIVSSISIHTNSDRNSVFDNTLMDAVLDPPH